MLRSIGKQSKESVEKKRKDCSKKDLQEKESFKPRVKEWGLMGDLSI